MELLGWTLTAPIKSRSSWDAFSRVKSAFRRAILPRIFKTLEVNLTSNGLERILDEISPSTMSYCESLTLVMTEVDLPDEAQKLYMKLLHHLTKLQSVTIQVARAKGQSVISYLPITKAVLRITSEVRQASSCAINLKTLDRYGFAMLLDDFGAFLQCPFREVSVTGLTVLSVNKDDKELLAASTTLSKLRSLELHSSDVDAFYLTTMIQSKYLRKISMSRNREPVSCAYIFNLRNVKETLVEASLLDMPFYRVVENKVASSAPHTSTSPLPQTLLALESLRIGQREGPWNQNLSLRPLFDAFRMPALKRLELVISGQQTWFLETLQDIMAVLPSLKEMHVADEWHEKFTERPNQDFQAGLLAFEAICRNKAIAFTLSVTIKTLNAIDLGGLSYNLGLWKSSITRLHFAHQSYASLHDDYDAPLHLPRLQKLSFALNRKPGDTRGLDGWLNLLEAPALADLDVTIGDRLNGRYAAAAILKSLPTFKRLSRLSMTVPVGFDEYMHNLKQTCASQGVDFSVRFQ